MQAISLRPRGVPLWWWFFAVTLSLWFAGGLGAYLAAQGKPKVCPCKRCTCPGGRVYCQCTK